MTDDQSTPDKPYVTADGEPCGFRDDFAEAVDCIAAVAALQYAYDLLMDAQKTLQLPILRDAIRLIENSAADANQKMASFADLMAARAAGSGSKAE